MKKTIAPILAAAVLLSGCGGRGGIYSNYRETEHLLPVQTLGLDSAPTGVRLSVSCAAPGQGSGPDIISRDGRSILDAMDSLQDYSAAGQLYYSHAQYVVLGEDYARAGVGEALDFLARDGRMRMGLLLFIARENSAQTLITGPGEGSYDITGALAAAALNAQVYENWTDVSGILMADPRIVEDPRPIERATYSELRQLSYSGAQVLHEMTVFPVREKNIPLNIRNTNEPDHPGTLVSEEFRDTRNPSRFITGIAGKKDFSIVTISKKGMAGAVGTLRAMVEVFEKNTVPICYTPTGIDVISMVVPSEKLTPHLYSVTDDLRRAIRPDNIKVVDGISIIAVVGRKMAYRAGTSGKIFAALGEKGINIRMISQGPDELNILVGVDNKDYAETVRVLYNAFVK